MSNTPPCPPEVALRHLLEGEPRGEEQAELLAHLAHCADCQRTLERLAGATPAVLGATRTLRNPASALETPLRRVLERLEDQATWVGSEHPPAGATWVRGLLKPADAPGTWGKLGDYQVLGLLGQGAMGLVLEAFDPALKRRVAIKVLAPQLAGDPLA